MRKKRICLTLGVALIILAGFGLVAAGQEGAQKVEKPMSGYERGQVHDMLHTISADIKKHYYDPSMHGVNWDEVMKEADGKIAQATTMNRGLSIIAGALDKLDDSHVFFAPPPRPYKHDYGIQMKMIGDRCFITRVRPGSDGEAKGVKPGDEILELNGYPPTRDTLNKMVYVYWVLRPQPGLMLLLRSPDGKERKVGVAAKVRELKRLLDFRGEDGGGDIWDWILDEQNWERREATRFRFVGSDVMILKIPIFFLSESETDGAFDQARTKKAMIVDLRGNHGGDEDMLKRALGNVMEGEVKIGDRKSRKESKPLMTKPRGRNAFSGKLIVLVDSESASASELFARMVQIEKRGIVLGDRSAGAVMEAKHYGYDLGAGRVLFFGASITEADIIMTDGKSLEHTGVVPDEMVIPSAEDMAAGRDPVLAHAVELCGAKVTPEEAGKLFPPYEWPKQ